MPPKMFPAELSEDVRADPKRRAEVEVFDTLKHDATLNEKWRIFYSLDWIGADEGITKDGEADFVVAHPEIGFLVLEVKGGIVTVKPGRKWISVGSGGKLHEIENGMRQAMKSKKALLKAMLRTWPTGRTPFIRNRHGVVLPDSVEPPEEDGDPAAGMPRSLFVFKRQMEQLGLRIREMINWNAPGADDKIGLGGETGIRLLEGLFGREIEMKPRLSDEIADAERRIAELSENQKSVLKYVKDHRYCLVQGGAGTGKTIIAMEKARREADAGKNVLFLCFNAKLRSHIEAQIRASCADASVSDRIHIYTFHGYCRRFSDSGSPPVTEGEEYFSIVLPNALLEAITAEDFPSDRPEFRFDALVVDEGQDFEDEWLRMLYELVEITGSSMTIFQDANQNIYRQNEAKRILRVQPITLDENFRNTSEIFSALRRYVEGTGLVSAGPPGPSVRWIESEKEDLVETISHQLEYLIETEGVVHDDAVVLTGSALEKSGLPDTIIGVECHTAWSFKGLDRSVVLLTDLKNVIKIPALAYVALSRARSLLIVIGTASQLALLEKSEHLSNDTDPSRLT